MINMINLKLIIFYERPIGKYDCKIICRYIN